MEVISTTYEHCADPAAGRYAFCVVNLREYIIYRVLPGKGTAMKRLPLILLPILLILAFVSCENRERITETEYVHDIKYIESPPDTVLRIDTLYNFDTLVHYDTVFSGGGDTVLQYDTVMQIDTIYSSSIDTVTITEVVYDTTRVYDTVNVINTVYDTVIRVDTVTQQACAPFVQFAFAALQYHADGEVIAFINSEFGYDDGWVYYLSIAMSDVSSPSTGVYDFYGYIDYWAPDFSGYYPLEYYWRISFTGGDPSDPDNWNLSDPPAAPKKDPGVRLSPDTELRSIAR